MDNFLKIVNSSDLESIKITFKQLKNITKEDFEYIISKIKDPTTCQYIKNLYNENYEKEQIEDSEFADDDFNNELSDNEALKKHSLSNQLHNKAIKRFFEIFKENIHEKWSSDRAAYLSLKIVDAVKDQNSNFASSLRPKLHNFKKNKKLCVDVYKGKIKPFDFVDMGLDEMKSDDLKSKDAKSVRDGFLAAQIPKPEADTNLFTCGKCKQKKCTYSQLQTRSCDEPMTTFVTCTSCGHRWKF